MSSNQTDIALRMIKKAQEESGHEFQPSDFRRLITTGQSSAGVNTKEMQAIIKEMLAKN
jgi:hypothetical protein